MEKKKAKAVVVTMLDEVAWLFNLRGSDIDYNPGEHTELSPLAPHEAETAMSSVFFICNHNAETSELVSECEPARRKCTQVSRWSDQYPPLRGVLAPLEGFGKRVAARQRKRT